ncbi:hypothetical protein [Elioraea sp.]|uniref:hypothetical protein n=1 Tax=Elioraea sp. TaxID=2185103 RepID=UPI003F723178
MLRVTELYPHDQVLDAAAIALFLLGRTIADDGGGVPLLAAATLLATLPPVHPDRDRARRRFAAALARMNGRDWNRLATRADMLADLRARIAGAAR